MLNEKACVLSAIEQHIAEEVGHSSVLRKQYYDISSQLIDNGWLLHWLIGDLTSAHGLLLLPCCVQTTSVLMIN